MNNVNEALGQWKSCPNFALYPEEGSLWNLNKHPWQNHTLQEPLWLTLFEILKCVGYCMQYISTEHSALQVLHKTQGNSTNVVSKSITLWLCVIYIFMVMVIYTSICYVHSTKAFQPHS